MEVQLGAHVGQQNFSMDEMRALWRWLDASGFDWISAWDHLYEAPPTGGTITHFEAVATLAALAVETTNARIGCLVFYVGYRNPGLLTKAAVTIDHLSGGRFELGLGGGWHQWEAAAFGYDFPSVGQRLDMLEEATELISLLLRETGGLDLEAISRAEVEPPRSTYSGQHYSLAEASCLPPPVDDHLPIWIGGVGERRTLPLAARLADGWNAAYISADEFARLNEVLDRACVEIGRDPTEIERSVNVVFGMSASAENEQKTRSHLRRQWGSMYERIEHGAVIGGPEQVAGQVMAYAEAGADLVNIALRSPFDDEALAAYQEVVMPIVRLH